jgi:hypothetical protein
MIYAKIIDGVLHFPPYTSHRPNGETVIGYPSRPDLLVEDGYKPVAYTEKPEGYFAPSWRDDADQITQVWTAYEPPAPQPFSLSKVKLLRAFDALGVLDVFCAFLAADQKRKLLWDAAVTIETNDPLVVDVLPSVAAQFGIADMGAFLESCRSDIQ